MFVSLRKEIDMEWKESTAKYTTGENLFLGRWKVASAYYDGTSANSENKWAAACALPGIKDRLGHFDTIETAKKTAEEAVVFWLKRAGYPLDTSSEKEMS